MTLTQQRGWSNAKRIATARRFVDAAVKDPVATGVTVVVSGAAVAAAVVLPKPVGLVVPAAVLGASALGWSARRAGRPVSFLVERSRWEKRREELTAIPGLQVDVDGGARAVNQDGTVHDVRLTCRRQDADAVQRAL